jgi:hypothetical protein
MEPSASPFGAPVSLRLAQRNCRLGLHLPADENVLNDRRHRSRDCMCSSQRLSECGVRLVTPCRRVPNLPKRESQPRRKLIATSSFRARSSPAGWCRLERLAEASA